ncbi:MAG: dihydrodipicolinate synthase family protein [Devosia sp.]
MKSSDLNGVIAASLTPLKTDFSIDSVRLGIHVADLLATGCSFVSTFGTTGEGASLSTDEKIIALRAMSQAGADMARQIPSIMTPTVDDAARMLAVISELGCRGALVLPPFYYPGWTNAGVARFISEMVRRAGSAAKADILLYNIPGFSRVRYTPELIEMIIADHGDRIVGLKDSTGETENGVMLAQKFPDLSIFTGDDRVMPDLRAAGGAGMIGGMPNLFARDLAALFADGNNAALRAKAAERIGTVDSHGGLAALKAAKAHYSGDANWARVAPPLMPLDAAASAAVVATFDGTGFDYANG